MKTIARLGGCALLAFATLGLAQSASATGPATRIAANFTNLAGSDENALALVNALRAGSDVSLSATAADGTVTTTTFTPPTGKMGWGNVSHSLALAQDALTRAGITHPTNAQRHAE